MAKDWHVEYEKLKEKMKTLERELQYYKDLNVQRFEQEVEFRNNFKKLLMDTLGRD